MGTKAAYRALMKLTPDVGAFSGMFFRLLTICTLVTLPLLPPLLGFLMEPALLTLPFGPAVGSGCCIRLVARAVLQAALPKTRENHDMGSISPIC